MAQLDVDQQILLSPISELVFSDPIITRISEMFQEQLDTTNDYTSITLIEQLP